MLSFQITQAAIVILGLLVGLVAILGSFTEVTAIVINYLRKLFAGPVKTEPFSSQQPSDKKS